MHEKPPAVEPVAPGVARLALGIANAYLLGEPAGDGPWLLVDTGLAGNAQKIRAAARARFGPDRERPGAILLTHGHTDHAGSVRAAAEGWGNLPVYLHDLERPFLDGRGATYPPPDPTVGGFMALMVRLLPSRPIDLSGLDFRSLPADGTVPHAPGWRWLRTPGHAPGHVSLWRESDRTLLAADALLTVNPDSLVAVLTRRRQLSRPPTPITCDWTAARASVECLARLRPVTVASGHGLPVQGGEWADRLADFAARCQGPAHGRYAHEPARTDENGVVYLPPAPPDPLPKQLRSVGWTLAALGLGTVAGAFVGRKTRRS